MKYSPRDRSVCDIRDVLQANRRVHAASFDGKSRITLLLQNSHQNLSTSLQPQSNRSQKTDYTHQYMSTMEPALPSWITINATCTQPPPDWHVNPAQISVPEP